MGHFTPKLYFNHILLATLWIQFSDCSCGVTQVSGRHSSPILLKTAMFLAKNIHCSLLAHENNIAAYVYKLLCVGYLRERVRLRFFSEKTVSNWTTMSF